MENTGNYYTRGRFYTSAEKRSLRSGDLDLAMDVCRARHDERAVALAFAREGDTRLKANGIPKVLDSLCVRLGISYPSGPNPVGEKGLRPRNRQREIVKYLASLPNAESYQEQHWLDTPEFWAFADLSDADEFSEDASLKNEIRRKAASWCDRWVLYSSVSFVSLKGAKDHIYMFPFADELKKPANRPRMKYLKSHTWLAYSQVIPPGKPGNISRTIQDQVLNLAERMTVGYVSFRCGISVADVVSLLLGRESNPEKDPANPVQNPEGMIG